MKVREIRYRIMYNGAERSSKERSSVEFSMDRRENPNITRCCGYSTLPRDVLLDRQSVSEASEEHSRLHSR
jgi:hypothetical protein